MLDILNKSSTAHRTTHSAAPECRVCNRRRIRCDGTRPACRKCMSRGLECSGYGKTFKWICGAASKGPNRIIFPTAPTRYHSHQFAEASIQSSPVVPSYQKPTVLYGYKQLPSLLSSTSLPGIENLLLQHFVDVVSVQLAWCEGEPNPWRIIVLPLAMESLGPSSSLYSLLSVILGVAASNVASRLAEGDTQRDMYLRITDTLRAKAFRFLSEDLRVLRGALQSGSPRPPQLLVQTVITSVLLLSYLEVHWPSSGMWHFHLRTAQNISNMMQFAATTDSINAFLSEELFSASTWALLTHYPPNEVSGTLEPYGKCGAEQRVNGKSPFIAFVVVMRRVTQARRNTAIRRVERVKQLAIFCTILQNALFDLDKAYKMVLKEPNTVYSTNRHDFECVVSAYYHATQIYCHQALSTDVSKLDEGLSVCSDQSTLLRLRTNLLDSLLSLENPASLAQSQPWPLFVLATVSTQDPTAQSWIEMRMNYVMELYCELDRPRMLRFLKSFWGQAAYDNWIEYAQSWIQSHGNFLIL